MSAPRGRPRVAVSIENDRLAAVLADVGPRGIAVRSWLVAERPPDADPSDPGRIGTWIAAELRKGGMLRAAKGGVDFGAARAEVVLKRVFFPPGVGEAELPGMVALHVARALTAPAQNAAIDFLPAGATGAGGTAVLVGVLQNDRIGWRRDVCRAAGVRLRRVGLLSAGAAALLGEAAARRNGAVLGVSLGCAGAEFVVIRDGQLLFARATDLVRPADGHPPETFAQKVAVEAKRTAMSFRASAEGAELEAVLVLGTDDLARQVAAWCGETLELPAAPADTPGFVDAGAMTPAERSSLGPLLGLLAEPSLGRPSLDFVNPRRAPDRAAGRRRAALLAALAAILVIGGGLTLARADLNRRAAALDEERDLARAQEADYRKFLLEQARVEHLRRFAAARVDWLSHIRTLGATLPDRRDVVFDVISGRSSPEVVYTAQRDHRAYTPSAWSDSARAVFSLSGTTRRRGVADAFRARLVSDDRYSVQTKGADVANRFDWTISTPHRSVAPGSGEPRAVSDAPPATGAKKPGGGA